MLPIQERGQPVILLFLNTPTLHCFLSRQRRAVPPAPRPHHAAPSLVDGRRSQYQDRRVRVVLFFM